MKTNALSVVALLSAGLLALGSAGCQRRTAENKSSADATAPEPTAEEAGGAPGAKRDEQPTRGGKNVYATWYDVPDDSLAARRAAPDELTAAHNRLPIGTRVRVTHLKTGKTVVVRITDRGIPRGHPPLDLCRAAAEELGMVREGRAKVHMEVLPDDKISGAKADARSAAPHS